MSGCAASLGLRAATRHSTTTRSSRSATRASGPPPATRPARTTPRSGPSSTCWRRRRGRASRSRSRWRCCPAASVSGFYFWHPQARYFGLGRIGRDQLEDYARRKGWSIAEAERWLAPNLNDDATRPAAAPAASAVAGATSPEATRTAPAADPAMLPPKEPAKERVAAA